MLAKGELAAVRARAQSASTLGVQTKVPWPPLGSWEHPPTRGAVALLSRLNVGAIDAPLILQRSRAQTRRGTDVSKPKARRREHGHRVANTVDARGRHVPACRKHQRDPARERYARDGGHRERDRADKEHRYPRHQALYGRTELRVQRSAASSHLRLDYGRGRRGRPSDENGGGKSAAGRTPGVLVAFPPRGDGCVEGLVQDEVAHACVGSDRARILAA
jgi:hypothetical protein